MSYKLLTNLLFEPRGKHDPSLTYNIKDTVMSEDGSKVYFALDNVPAGIPLTDTNYWMLQIDLSASKNAMDVAATNARTQTDATIASANTRVEDMMGKAADAVTSVADYAAKVGMRVKGETKIAKGNPMTIYPDGGSLLKVQTDIPIKQLGSGDSYPAGGGRNKLRNTATTQTINGVTFTVNSDGSVTANGTATSSATLYLSDNVESGDYILSGGVSASAFVDVILNYTQVAKSEGSDAPVTIPDGAILEVRIVVANGITVNATFYPMLRLASDPDVTYAPPSNIRPFVGYDALNLNHMGKNLCPTSSVELVHWSVPNSDILNVLNSLPAGTYTFSAKWKLTNTFTSEGTMLPTDLYGVAFYNSGADLGGGQKTWGTTSIG